jgi:hypothetical protein
VLFEISAPFEPYEYSFYKNLFQNIAAVTSRFKTGCMGTLTNHDNRLLLEREARFKEFYG